MTNPEHPADSAKDDAREAERKAHAEYMRKWRANNPERAKATQRRGTQRARAKQRKRRAGRAHYTRHRDEIREKARRFRQENPDKIREYQKRWKEKDPERAKELGRRTGEVYRDRHGDELRDRGRKAAAARRERDPEAFKRWYEQNLEAQRARGRAASQLRSRLKKLGLPPRSIHRVYAEEKRANARAAEEFFTRTRTRQELRLMQAPDAGVHVRLRTMQIAEQSTEQRRAADNFLFRLPALLRFTHEREGDRIREEIRMDNQARIGRGEEPYDIREETGRRVLREVLENEAPPLAPERVGQMLALLRRSRTEAPTRPNDTMEELRGKIEQNARTAQHRRAHARPDDEQTHRGHSPMAAPDATEPRPRGPRL